MMGVAEWLFVAVMASALALLGRHTWRSARAARRQHAEADRLTRTSASTVAEEAVTAERRRLSVEIETCVHDLLVSVGKRAVRAAEAADPRPELRAVQAEAQEANAELRRQLGLLRAEPDPVPGPVPDPVPDLVPTDARRGDLIPAAVAIALAGLDLVLAVRVGGDQIGWVAVVLTSAVAGTVLGRRMAPRAAALVAAALLATGAFLGAPVVDGFGLALAVGLLAFALAAGAGPRDWVALVVLTAALVVSRQLADPDNVAMSLALVVVASGTGALVGRSRRRRRRAAAVAAARGAELRAAAELAVRSERRVVAGELHDLLAHAVSVIAVQAGAAEVTWPHDPAVARRAIGVVGATAEETLRELEILRGSDRSVPGGSGAATAPELDALLDRIRAAGLPLRSRLDRVEPAVASTVYRIVQESLTNVLRHAPGRPTEVTVVCGTDVVVVTVVNQLPEPAATGRGYGLAGLAERVQRWGGSFAAGARDDPPRFEVRAVLQTTRLVAAVGG